MPRYVLLLRGVNVGGHKRVAMADLRRVLCGLGYTGVRTYLQSGNAVFAAGERRPEDEMAGRVEDAIGADLGLSVRCLVRAGSELRAVAGGNPLLDMATDGSRMIVLFLSAAPDPQRLADHDPARLAPGRIVLRGRVIYQWCPDGVLAAPDVGGFVGRQHGLTATARNWNTVTKLVALLDER